MKTIKEFGVERKHHNGWWPCHSVGDGFQSKADALDKARQLYGWFKYPHRVILYDYTDNLRLNIQEIKGRLNEKKI